MKTTTIVLMLQMAGLAHLGMLAAGALMPGVVGLRRDVTRMGDFAQRLFWVYYGFIGLCIVSFGTITVLFAAELASGAPLARGLCVFFAMFWTIRAVVAGFVFDLRPFITNRWQRIGYYAMNTVFCALPLVYLAAALIGK